MQGISSGMTADSILKWFCLYYFLHSQRRNCIGWKESTDVKSKAREGSAHIQLKVKVNISRLGTQRRI